MDRVNSMKLTRIFNNKKAMSPIMIGVIVAASIVTVTIIVMAAVIPFLSHNVNMQIRSGSVKSYSETAIDIQFLVYCDYNDGEIWRAEIFHEGERYGFRQMEQVLYKNSPEEVYISYFDAEEGLPSSDLYSDGTTLLFQDGSEYVLRIYYHNIDSDITTLYNEVSFTFELD